ncbi:MAG: hypothetical protein JNK52_17135, partial [Zoogloeaceae bacterium]|nr:hypothetical protein [Zoogloeaceae bacterium]
GRRPGLELAHQGKPIGLQEWGLQLLDRIEACARLLDTAHGDDLHHQGLVSQRAKLLDASITPSARVLQSLDEDKLSFFAFAQRQSERHSDWFRSRPLDAEHEQRFERAAQASLASQERMEREDRGSFDEFVARYMAAIGA